MFNEQHPSPRLCPLCNGGNFAPTGEPLDIQGLLDSWERGLSITFSQTVRRQYGPPSPQELSLCFCAQCGLGMFVPPLTGTREFYEEIQTPEYYTPAKWEFIRAIRHLKKTRPQRILDVGCGSGNFLDLLKASSLPGHHAGYEFNFKVAKLAAAKGHTVYLGPFPQAVLAGEDGKLFDAICLFQVLEHDADPVAFLLSLRGLLKEGGSLIVAVPDAQGPVRHFCNEPTDLPPHHVSRWCEQAFRMGMPRIGLSVLDVAREPLPNFLWQYYLPVMMERDLLPPAIGRWVNKAGLTSLLMRSLRRLGLTHLPGVRGHTLYVVLRNEGREN